MAIISSVVIRGVFNRVTSPNEFYYCIHSSDFVLSRSLDNESPIVANGQVDTKSDVFGADTYQELIDEIARLNLIDNV